VESPSPEEGGLGREAEDALSRLIDTPAGCPRSDAEAPQGGAPAGASLTGALIPIWRVVDAVVTRAAGEAYALTPQEIRELADATGPVMDRYLPAFICNHGEFVALTLAVVGVYSAKHLAAEAAAAAPAQHAINTPMDVPEGEA